MTIETKGTIELKDILAVEFECQDCGAIISRPLNEELRIPLACGNCDALPWHASNRPEGQELRTFFLQIQRYAAQKLPYSLRFQVAGLEKAPRPSPVTAPSA